MLPGTNQDVTPKSASAGAEPSAVWRPVSEAEPMPGIYINVRSVETYRWLAYKPDGIRQMKKAGRWQRATEYGWENAPLPERGEWIPNEIGAAK